MWPTGGGPGTGVWSSCCSSCCRHDEGFDGGGSKVPMPIKSTIFDVNDGGPNDGGSKITKSE